MILDSKGNPYPNKPHKQELAGHTVGGIRSIWNTTYPASNLGPEKLASILRAADHCDLSEQMHLFEQMEESDPHLFSILQTRKRAVASLPYEVSPCDDDDKSKEVAETISDIIKNIPKFRNCLRDMMDAVGKGFSVLEVMYRYNNLIVVSELKYRPQAWFTFDKKSGEELRLLSDGNSYEGESMDSLKYQGKFITSIFQAKSGIPSRGGILRVCAWSYMFKNYSVKDWVVFAEVFGMPLRLGRYGASASEPDKDILADALENLGSDAWGMIPESMQIEFIEAQKTGKLNIFEDLASFCDRQMSKAVLGQTLTSDGSDKGSGSYALGNIHDGVRNDLVKSDAEELSEIVTRDLVVPLVIFNFGEQEKYPKFNLIAKTPKDLEKLAKVVKSLSETGLPIGKMWVYDEFGIPEPKEGEEVLEPPSAMPPEQFPAKNTPRYLLEAKKKLQNSM